MWAEYFVDSLFYFGAIVIAELLLVMPSIARRKYFPAQFIIAVAVCVAICILRAFLCVVMPGNAQIISDAYYLSSSALAAATIFVSFHIHLNSLLWVILASYAVARIVYVQVFYMIFSLTVQTEVSFWIQLAVFCVVCVPVYFIFFKVFKHDIKYLGSMNLDAPHKGNVLLFLMIVGYIAIVIMFHCINAGGYSGCLPAVCDVIFGLFVLVTQAVTLSTARNSFQKNMWEVLFKENKKQYEIFRNTVDYINIKCHDLKHEIEYLQHGGVLNPVKIKQLAENVSIYETFAKTGNETLDILFTEKNITCLSEGITFTYMADATGLNVMAGSDIYSLFGNLLDNAIEYLRTVDKGNDRFIRLFIKPQSNRLVIHEENYYIYTNKGTFKEGIPVTTKPDKIRHGFGIRSMMRIARQYGGDLLISTEEDLFKVDIYINIS